MSGDQFGDFQLNVNYAVSGKILLSPISAGKHEVTKHRLELLARPSPSYLNMIPWCQSAGTGHMIKAVEQLFAQFAYFVSSRPEREFTCWHFSPIGSEIQLKYKELKTYKKGTYVIATSSSLCTLSPHAFQFRLLCLGTNLHWALWVGEFVCYSHNSVPTVGSNSLEPQTFCY